jgi:hypothetical protein
LEEAAAYAEEESSEREAMMAADASILAVETAIGMLCAGDAVAEGELMVDSTAAEDKLARLAELAEAREAELTDANEESTATEILLAEASLANELDSAARDELSNASTEAELAAITLETLSSDRELEISAREDTDATLASDKEIAEI